jgi:hypothetical protein
MKNIYVISTDKPSRLYKTRNKFYLEPYPDKSVIAGNQNIYISNDEEIKEGDYIGYPTLNNWVPIKYLGGDLIGSEKKIILTTDQDLIKDGIQAIDDEFLEWFAKNPSCEYVKIDKLVFYEHKNYKIIIPKKEAKQENCCTPIGQIKRYVDCVGCDRKPKQEIVGYRLNSNISRVMVDRVLQYSMPNWNDKDKSVYFIRGHVGGSLVAKMKELKVLDLWFTPIYESEEVKSDWIKEHHIDYYKKEGMMADKPLQETLEEVAKRLYEYQSQNPPYTIITPKAKIEGFIAGAKWQAERSYSEEDLISFAHFYFKEEFNSTMQTSKSTDEIFKEWFEQFKKK